MLISVVMRISHSYDSKFNQLQIKSGHPECAGVSVCSDVSVTGIQRTSTVIKCFRSYAYLGPGGRTSKALLPGSCSSAWPPREQLDTRMREPLQESRNPVVELHQTVGG